MDDNLISDSRQVRRMLWILENGDERMSGRVFLEWSITRAPVVIDEGGGPEPKLRERLAGLRDGEKRLVLRAHVLVDYLRDYSTSISPM